MAGFVRSGLSMREANMVESIAIVLLLGALDTTWGLRSMPRKNTTRVRQSGSLAL